MISITSRLDLNRGVRWGPSYQDINRDPSNATIPGTFDSSTKGAWPHFWNLFLKAQHVEGHFHATWCSDLSRSLCNQKAKVISHPAFGRLSNEGSSELGSILLGPPLRCPPSEGRNPNCNFPLPSPVDLSTFQSNSVQFLPPPSPQQQEGNALSKKL